MVQYSEIGTAELHGTPNPEEETNMRTHRYSHVTSQRQHLCYQIPDTQKSLPIVPTSFPYRTVSQDNSLGFCALKTSDSSCVFKMMTYLLEYGKNMYEVWKGLPKWWWPTKATTAYQRFQEHRLRLRKDCGVSNGVLVDRAMSDAVDEQWQALPSYEAALSMNQAYINGEIASNIGYWGPLDPETKELVPGLLKLHEYGFLTHSSQPFEPVQREFKDINGGWWQEWRQRPYLDFLAPQQDRIPEKAIEKFTLLLLAHPRIVTWVAYNDAGRSYRTNINGHHTTTEYRLALSPEELDKEDFKVSTSVSADYHHVTEDWPNVNTIVQARCLDISIASRSWDKDIDLPKLVEETAIKAGIKPLYASKASSHNASHSADRNSSDEQLAQDMLSAHKNLVEDLD